jgi:hypothetical protein
VIAADANGGCVGGSTTGAHAVAATHRNSIALGPDCVGVSVGAVGDFEQPIAINNTKLHNVRVTTSLLAHRSTLAKVSCTRGSAC